jgi:phosphoribosylformylglycinamidine synthase
MTTDVTPRYCRADPFEGGKQAVAEAWRNLTASGATPLAVTDNLNYGNPQKPEIMWQIVAGIEGIGEACRALDFPVIGGNCSLYNETNGEGILPTPAIGGVGLIKDVGRRATMGFKREGDVIILIGETRGHLGQSIYLREIEGKEEGTAPPVDLAAERRHGDFVRGLIEKGRVDTAHDLSDGGLLVAIAEMALKDGIGASIGHASLADAIAFFFGEDQARYLIAVPFAEAEKIVAEARAATIPVAELGKTGGDVLVIDDKERVSLKQLRDGYEGWFPRFMAREEIPLSN